MVQRRMREQVLNLVTGRRETCRVELQQYERIRTGGQRRRHPVEYLWLRSLDVDFHEIQWRQIQIVDRDDPHDLPACGSTAVRADGETAEETVG